MTLSTTDKKILQRIQTNLPLTNRPFRDLAEELELDEDLVIERIKFMIQGKYVRRLAPIINTQAVGNSATLAAIQVPDDKIEEVLHLLELLYERANDSGVGDGKFNQDLWDTETII